MVLEHILDQKKVVSHPVFIPGIVFVYTLISYAISHYFFGRYSSVAMIFTLTLMITPSLMHIMRMEEKLESKVGLKHFFKTHTLAFEVFGLAFIGVFLGFLFIGSFTMDAFGFQMNMLEARQSVGPSSVAQFVSAPPVPTPEITTAVFTHNIVVALAAVLLSLFYGAGSVFLLILNASVFAAYILWLVKFSGWNAGLSILIHLPLEMIGFLLAVIGGATLSWALLDERFGTKQFRNVSRNVFMMICLSAGILVVAAVLEVYVTAPVLYGILS